MTREFGFLYSIMVLLILCQVSCKPDDSPTMDDDQTGAGIDLTDIPYSPEQYPLKVPSNFAPVPFDTATLYKAEVDLGRHLFYDPILSADFTQSCSSCHLPEGGFTDNLAVSTGIDDIAGKRSSMSLLNIGYREDFLFWDGRANSLEEQALLPVEDVIELHNTWSEVIDRLKAHEDYPTKFRQAFGISNTEEITKELAAKALAQFERIIISSGKARFDRLDRGETFYSDDENAGRDIFFDDGPDDAFDGECSHCHGGKRLDINGPISDQFRNNGIDAAQGPMDYLDPGLGAITNNTNDFGKFRAPSLRNIVNTAPYMHDGRFATLEEVINHYFSGGHEAYNADGLMSKLKDRNFGELQKAQLLEFLKTLDDKKLLDNPDLLSPF